MTGVKGQKPSSFASMQGTRAVIYIPELPVGSGWALEFAWNRFLLCLFPFSILTLLLPCWFLPGGTFLIKHLLLNPWLKICFWENLQCSNCRMFLMHSCWCCNALSKSLDSVCIRNNYKTHILNKNSNHIKSEKSKFCPFSLCYNNCC